MVDLVFLYLFGKQDVKILFLDVDGVLNTINDCDSEDIDNIADNFVNLNPKLMQRLKQIVKITNCKIVLRSDWRLTVKDKDELFATLRKIVNLDLLNSNIYIGDTPIVKNGFYRALED